MSASEEGGSIRVIKFKKSIGIHEISLRYSQDMCQVSRTGSDIRFVPLSKGSWTSSFFFFFFFKLHVQLLLFVR